jgi:ankyrin repeat protein
MLLIPCCCTCRLADEGSVHTLLELGADPNAGGTGEAINSTRGLGQVSGKPIVELLLRHGADCLLPSCPGGIPSFLADGTAQPGMHLRTGSTLNSVLADLERQRAAGQLERGSAAQAAALLLGAIPCGDEQLFTRALACMEACLNAAGSPAPDQEAGMLRCILVAAISSTRASSPARLQALLASGLPFDLATPDTFGQSPLVCAALSGGAATVQLLHRAGAPLTALDLLCAVDRRCAGGLAALLSAGTPAIDTTQASQKIRYTTSYTCPIHRALHAVVRTPAGMARLLCWWAIDTSGSRGMAMLLCLETGA